MGNFVSSDELRFSAFDMGVMVKRLSTMDYEGNLRLHSLNSTGSWVITWRALIRQCRVHAICGRNGIFCLYTPEPKCACPAGYEVFNTSNWNKVNQFQLQLAQSSAWRISVVKHVPIGEKCYTKGDLFSGHWSPSFRGTTYLRLPQSVETSQLININVSNPCRNNKLKVGGYFSEVDRYHLISSHYRMYLYTKLKKATENFKEELGGGASEAVYQGVLADERVVAVKKLAYIYQAEEVFWAEVSTIRKINHMNLVRTWEFCSENKQRLMISEFVENRSLDKHLFHPNFLGWKERFKVAIGIARGYGVVLLEILKGIRLSNRVVENGEEQEAELKRFLKVAKRKIQCGEDE
ncbi:S-locus-like receptor protein kinase [Prunus yedoensis var. nudiflora]|uniref:non-specific serine/threonine protein kinase n=1 Tax=Prunus yedoensis var. nudiflora TaxID=2094558 RepID=A0A314UPQ8_PRUYE|nr:S-locus-like receptor protein kinase [Prunus yedoensis var. nudiflora]